MCGMPGGMGEKADEIEDSLATKVKNPDLMKLKI